MRTPTFTWLDRSGDDLDDEDRAALGKELMAAHLNSKAGRTIPAAEAEQMMRDAINYRRAQRG
jgi:hypothetical protein